MVNKMVFKNICNKIYEHRFDYEFARTQYLRIFRIFYVCIIPYADYTNRIFYYAYIFKYDKYLILYFL